VEEYFHNFYILLKDFQFIKIKSELKNDYTKLKKAFGAQIRKIRDEKEISLRDLATKCDLDSSQISKIENAVWDVQLSTIFELAKGLGVEPKELLDFKI
jgi:DNA-binding Xre family transcriptional regulator